MSGVRINEFDCGGARRAELLLGNIPGASDRVIRKAAEKAAAFLRTESRRLLFQRPICGIVTRQVCVTAFGTVRVLQLLMQVIKFRFIATRVQRPNGPA